MSDGDKILIPERRSAGRRLGRHINHDPRSRNFRAVSDVQKQTMSINTKVWRRHVAPFDQGDLGSCTGNAVVGCASTDPTFVNGKHYTEANAIKVYEYATQIDGQPGVYPPDDTGSDGLSACKGAVKLNLATEYLWGFGIEEMMLIVCNIGPVAVGTNWYDGMDDPDQYGKVRVSGSVRGGHEWQVLGFHADGSLKGPVGFFEAQNSWGKTWGVKGTSYGKGGRFYISQLDMKRLLTEGGDCVTLSTNKKV